MSRINACRKGKSAERRAAKYLRSLGFDGCRRGQQHAGGPESPDVVGVPGVHVEVKDAANVRLGTQGLADAVAQATRDAGPGDRPVVLWWEARKGWRLTWVPDGSAAICTVAGNCVGLALRHMAGRKVPDGP